MPALPIQITPFPMVEEVTLETGTGLRQDGFQPASKILVRDLPRDTVVALIEEFKSRMLTMYEQHSRERQRLDEAERTDLEGGFRR